MDFGHPTPGNENGFPAFPYYGPPPVYTRPPRRRRALVISLIALLLAALLTVSAVLIFGVPYRLRGNAGVAAAFEYVCAYIQQSDAMAGSVGREVAARLGKEPFEIECEMDIAPEQLEEIGLPISNIPVRIDVKYDLNDLGVRMSAMGLEAFGAYAIGDEFVLEVMGEAGSVQLDPPTDADLEEPMGLTERFLTLLPFLAEDRGGLYLRILETFALSVPDEYTDTYTADIYSPAAGNDVKTSVIETELDSEAILDVIHNFAGRLREDEALCDDIQALLDEVTGLFGLDDMDIDDLIGQLEEVDEGDIAGTDFLWAVYRREGRCSGISFTLSLPDMGTMTALSEFHNNVFYTSTKVETPDTVTETYAINTYSGDRVEAEGETTSESEFMSSTSQQSSTVEYTRGSDGEYSAELEMTIDEAYTYTDGSVDDTQQSIEVTSDIDFRFGSDLGTLKESTRWDNIYDKDWGTLDDLLGGFFPLGEVLDGALDTI